MQRYRSEKGIEVTMGDRPESVGSEKGENDGREWVDFVTVFFVRSWMSLERFCFYSTQFAICNKNEDHSCCGESPPAECSDYGSVAPGLRQICCHPG